MESPRSKNKTVGKEEKWRRSWRKRENEEATSQKLKTTARNKETMREYTRKYKDK